MNWTTAGRWIAGCLLVALFPVVSSGSMIDNFQTGSTNLSVYDGYNPGNSDFTLQTLLAGVIGGERRAEVDYLAGEGDVSLRINRANSGVFAFNEEAGTSGKAILDYGYTTPLDADLAASGNGFRINFKSADIAGIVNITLTSAAGTSFATITTPFGLFNGSEDRFAYFTGFAVQTGGGADFHHIDKIQFEFVGVDSGDYIVTEITTIPEPATLALLTLGAAAMLRRRK